MPSGVASGAVPLAGGRGTVSRFSRAAASEFSHVRSWYVRVWSTVGAERRCCGCLAPLCPHSHAAGTAVGPALCDALDDAVLLPRASWL